MISFSYHIKKRKNLYWLLIHLCICSIADWFSLGIVVKFIWINSVLNADGVGIKFLRSFVWLDELYVNVNLDFNWSRSCSVNYGYIW
jgi:hypothetical protein